MLGSRIEEMLMSEDTPSQGSNVVNGAPAATSMPFIAPNIAIINDETRQKQLLQEDEEEDFLDEGIDPFIRYLLQESFNDRYEYNTAIFYTIYC